VKLAEVLRVALKLPCAGKKRYDSSGEAAHVARVRTQAGAHDRARLLQVYPCDRCAGFHLTSKPHRSTLGAFHVIGDSAPLGLNREVE
jgi:hypothetical protein